MNRRVLKQQAEPSASCNCRSLKECPLNGKCLTESLVYQAEITATDVGKTKIYIGMTSVTFKKRYANHKKSISNPRYSSETKLSTYVWELMNKKRDFNIKWSVLKRVAPRAAGRKTCKRKNCVSSNRAGHGFWIEDPTYFQSADTVSSLARETLNARTIERTRRKTVSGMTLANNRKNKWVDNRLMIALWRETLCSDVFILRLNHIKT